MTSREGQQWHLSVSDHTPAWGVWEELPRGCKHEWETAQSPQDLDGITVSLVTGRWAQDPWGDG